MVTGWFGFGDEALCCQNAGSQQGQGVTARSLPGSLTPFWVFPALSSHQANKISLVQLGRSADAWRCPPRKGCEQCQTSRDLPQKWLIPFVAV